MLDSPPFEHQVTSWRDREQQAARQAARQPGSQAGMQAGRRQAGRVGMTVRALMVIRSEHIRPMLLDSQ